MLRQAVIMQVDRFADARAAILVVLLAVLLAVLLVSVIAVSLRTSRHIQEPSQCRPCPCWRFEYCFQCRRIVGAVRAGLQWSFLHCLQKGGKRRACFAPFAAGAVDVLWLNRHRLRPVYRNAGF